MAACLLLAAPGAADAASEKFPRPTGAINDFAGILSADVRARMESLSGELLQKTGAAVVVATVPSIGGEDADMYANDLYKAWGIGAKGQDKGALIFLALKERKVRIETGYGVEGILPDGLAGSILDQYVIPHLKSGDYNQGLLNCLLAVGNVIAKDAGVTIGQGQQLKRPAARKRQPQSSGVGALVLLALFILMMLTPGGRSILYMLLLSGLLGGRGGGGFGGFGGGGFGGFGGGGSGGGGASRGF
jgi:uncharacterized protein